MNTNDQHRVAEWMRTTFTEAENKDAPERTLRLAEEALELAQAVGVDAETLHRLVDYVFSRPAGKPAQEIAGTMVTLYAAASALSVDADAEFEIELARINTLEVIERCRRRQHEKREAVKAQQAFVAEVQRGGELLEAYKTNAPRPYPLTNAPCEVPSRDGEGTWFELRKKETL